jgi:iron complex transport system substrate-binding protein
VALNPVRLADVFADIGRVAEAAGVPESGHSYVQTLRGRIDAVRSVTDRLPSDDCPRVACIEWIEPLMVAANWMPELVELAGGVNGLTCAGDRGAHTGWEKLLAFDPQRIIVAPCGFDLERTLSEMGVFTEHSGWRELSAVKTGHVFAADGNAYFNRSGPRLVDSLEMLAHMIHPGLFPSANSRAFRHLHYR